MGVAPGLVAYQPRIVPHHQDDTINSIPTPNTRFFRPSLVASFPSLQSGLARLYQPNPQVRPDEKFLGYLPHSGFHNQRIVLENALVLARLLNRTSLVPPVRFGRRAIPYRNFTVLQRVLDANYTAYLCQLSDNATNRDNTPVVRGTLLDFPELPGRCMLKKERKSVTRTYLPWGWLTDFDSVRQLQPTIQTPGSTHFWLSTRLDPRADDVLIIPGTSKYQYHFIDEIVLDTSDPRTITNATYSEKNRLKFPHPAHRAIRKQIRRRMSLKHPLLQKSSVDVATKISGPGAGSSFLGAHLRCNDGYFLETAMERSRMFWWKLVHGVLGLSTERARQLELLETNEC
ncbi:hypothetical protein BDM02DRAFT_3190361 [Thelephora ganbajun]|uniref:Uncharacterized protein n=1 Tax=Thelephora ganbajun TaxID=370292 RepID=A0ACB6Z516_THEGA|nr:hypothetical protein BDM02DRAFT_3190361 [Thelephora ganbajun]